MAGHMTLMAGHMILVAGHMTVVAGHMILVAGHMILVAGHMILGAGHMILVAGHMILDAGHMTFIAKLYHNVHLPGLMSASQGGHSVVQFCFSGWFAVDGSGYRTRTCTVREKNMHVHV